MGEKKKNHKKIHSFQFQSAVICLPASWINSKNCQKVEVLQSSRQGVYMYEASRLHSPQQTDQGYLPTASFGRHTVLVLGHLFLLAARQPPSGLTPFLPLRFNPLPSSALPSDTRLQSYTPLGSTIFTGVVSVLVHNQVR